MAEAGAIDPRRKLRLTQSPLRPVFTLITALLLCAVCVAMAVPLFPQAPVGGRQQLYWWLGALFFAVGAVAVKKQSFGENRPVLVLSPEGFRYNTVSERVIPWTAVQGIRDWRHKRQYLVIVKLDDAAWESAGMSEAALKMRAMNKLQGIDGVAISATGLPITFPNLIKTFRTYARAHGARFE